MTKRIVVTGIGLVTPIGTGVKPFWENIKSGTCGMSLIESFDTTNYKVKVAGEIKDFDPTQWIGKKEAKRMDRFTQFSIAASRLAVEDASLEITQDNADRIGVYMGCGIGGLDTIQDSSHKMFSKGADRISPFFIPMSISNMAAGNVSIDLGIKGSCLTYNTACASSASAIGEALKDLRCGIHDVMLAGGTEASITPLGIGGFQAMTALCESSDPMRASIPFDKDRSGFVMAEGAAMLVLETLDHALSRGAKIYAELLGYGATSDAHHITTPAPGGEGGSRAMKAALRDAGLTPEDIGYINAHGTSTPYNDIFETAAIKSAFGPYAYKVPVSSTKSMTGHLLGAAGGVESAVCALALQNGFIPATINFNEADPECDLDYVPNLGREANISYALTNSLGFGGHNATLIFGKYPLGDAL
ncbi:beta-ketoacyl-ACP synthase II [Fusibacter tunisiensis]|uniref:3-oxoacyl-[acyl-carrier-protein] synthase 2 n=1 Tax=Fusibacter tunisiensis TaxID=1008308 RepID=A0ABS2MRR8_9FIRM|nr:beta-ketoacyl-ACP synthase II [Fusibacter tunisiensis]MBM7562007.1 3-oxoacyl-[acyl-carrier-protein] synthase II [Fusibacter tunisiensis]